MQSPRPDRDFPDIHATVVYSLNQVMPEITSPRLDATRDHGQTDIEINIDDYRSCSGKCFCLLFHQTLVSQFVFWICFIYYFVLYSVNNTSEFDLCMLHHAQARFSPDIFLRGYIWQLLVSIFVHQNPWHITCNCFSILYMLASFEIRWGALGTLFFFCFAGVLCGATASLARPTVIGCGASGPLLACMAGNMVWIAFGPDEQIDNPKRHRAILLLLNGFGLLATMVGDAVLVQNSDWIFHWSSILFGLCTGFILLPYVIQCKKMALKILYMISVVLVYSWILAILALGIWTGTTKQIQDYRIC
jgi:membrane associated rhomboid family serine protease